MTILHLITTQSLDHTVGQHVWEQDLRELQVAVRHLALSTSHPVSTLGASIVFAIQAQRLGHALLPTAGPAMAAAAADMAPYPGPGLQAEWSHCLGKW